MPDQNTAEDILVVDDATINLAFLRTVFVNEGYQVRTAEHGEIALALVKEKLPDLILLDIKMPDMDGYEVCRRLKADPRSRDVPVLFISALTDPLDKINAFSSGGVDYINKPFDLKELQARVRIHLTISRLQNELKLANETLEERIQKRTEELSLANIKLYAEVVERQNAEEELRLFKTIFDSSSEAITVSDTDGLVLYVNPAHEELFRRNLQQTKACAQSSQYPAETVAVLVREVEPRLAEGRGWQGEIEALDAAGRRFPLWQRADVILDDSGRARYRVGFMHDISKQKQSEAKLRTLGQAVEQSPVSVIITDPEGRIEYVNRAFEQISGYTSQEVLGKKPRILKSGETKPSRYRELWETIRAGRAWRGEFYNRKKDGTCYWERVHIAPVLAENGVISHYIAINEDVTMFKQQEEKLLYQAHFDELTGLPNRLLVLDRLSQIIKRSRRSNKRSAVLFLDLDDFKKINDTLGHDMGDRILVEAAQRLRGAVREEDTVSRLGGDEFIVLLSGLDNAGDAQPVAENILNAFRQVFVLDQRELLLTTSIGIAIYPEDGLDSSALLRDADTAMYQAKKEGRNTYRYFTETMNQEMVHRLTLEECLRTALEHNELHVHYQPLVDLASRRVVGAEALLRWESPILGRISPDEFIDVAERTGLILPIGDYVLEQALAQVAGWRTRFDLDFRVAVNVSPRQFRDHKLPERIEGLLRRWSLPASSLELEITENLLMSGQTHVSASLCALHEIGVGIAMDDFGTGYSSLSYLRQYHFNTLKIDKSFIHGLLINRGDRELVTAALTMAHNLGLKVVAEGVENEGQFAFLRERDCEFAQGFLFERPVPPELFENFLGLPVAPVGK